MTILWPCLESTKSQVAPRFKLPPEFFWQE